MQISSISPANAPEPRIESSIAAFSPWGSGTKNNDRDAQSGSATNFSKRFRVQPTSLTVSMTISLRSSSSGDIDHHLGDRCPAVLRKKWEGTAVAREQHEDGTLWRSS